MLRAHPEHFNALLLFGVLCSQSNLAQPAVDLIANALRVDPNHALAHCHHANALCQLQRYEQAIASYDRAIALDGQLADAYHARGLALFYLRKAAAALDSYDRALALDPKNGATLYNRGIALAEVGRDAEAIASFEAAVGIMPDRERLVLARRAAPLFDTRKLTTARTQHPIISAWHRRRVRLRRRAWRIASPRSR